MESKFEIKMNPMVVVALLLQVVFVVLLVVTFNDLNGSDAEIPKVEVGSLDSKTESLPEFGAEDIEYNIYLAIENNIRDGVVQKKGVNIRDGSLIENYYEEIGLHYLNFIVDIPDVAQSYQVVAKWEDGEQGDVLYDNLSGVATGVLCLDSEQLIYGEFDCKPLRSYMKNTILYSLLMSGAESIGDNVTLVPEYEGSEDNLRVKIAFSDCGEAQCICKVPDEAEKNVASAGFVDLMERLRLSMDDIPYYFYNCENEVVWIDGAGALQQKVN